MAKAQLAAMAQPARAAPPLLIFPVILIDPAEPGRPPFPREVAWLGLAACDNLWLESVSFVMQISVVWQHKGGEWSGVE